MKSHALRIALVLAGLAVMPVGAVEPSGQPRGNKSVSFSALDLTPLFSCFRDWYVQAGANGMKATSMRNNGAFILGGAGNDSEWRVAA